MLLRYVDIDAFRHLAQGLTFDVERCAEVLDEALVGLNQQTGVPDQIIAWIRARALAAGACPDGGQGRIIIEVSQIRNEKCEFLYLAAVLRKKDERETAPVVFLKMNSPVLDIPMRVELPLRALMKGNPPLKGTHTLYLHALLTDNGESFIYYGITKRGWNLRFKEHMRAALPQKSKRLLARKLDELIEARVDARFGKSDGRPQLAALISAICGSGMTRDAALSAEEYLVEKYSLFGKHPFGLNMIPGGLSGILQARRLLKPK